MKRIVAIFLSLGIFITGCGVKTDENADESTKNNVILEQEYEDDVPEFKGLEDEDLLGYVRDEVYADLVDNIDPTLYYVENVETSYVSKEYLDEIEFNSQSNIFFGMSLDEINEKMQGEKYVFTIDEQGKTIVEEMQELTDTTNEQMMKKVAIGTGVILVAVSVAALTQNPAVALTAGKSIKMVYLVSSSAAKTGIQFAGASAIVGGLSSGILEAYQTNDLEKAMKSSLVGMGEGFMTGAIVGTVSGGIEGIIGSVKKLKDFETIKYFKEGTEQAEKYSEGIKFTKHENGEYYPRFEKYAIDKVKFDKPTLKDSKNHTGLSGNYHYDQKLANKLTGRKYTPQGYVWHHCEDMQTMILVPQDVHSVALGGKAHNGGASLIRHYLESLE